MPIQHALLEDGIIRTRIDGFVTLEEIWLHVNQACASGEVTCLELVDARGANPVSISINDLMKIAQTVKVLLGDRTPGRRAIVVNTDDNRRLARAFVTLASAWIPMAIFDDPVQAEIWLGLSATVPDRTAGARAPQGSP